MRDRTLTALLVAQLLIVAVGEPLAALSLHRITLVITLIGRGLVIALVCASGNVYAIAGLALSLALAIPALLAPTSFSAHIASICFDASAALSWLSLSIVVAGTVFGRGRVSVGRVVGAVVLYLNVGMIFMMLFASLEQISPGSFAGLGETSDPDRLLAALLYFSVVTLTTTGYGDIVPVHPVARAMCNIEAIIGQLYPATILARIISLEIASATSSKATSQAERIPPLDE